MIRSDIISLTTFIIRICFCFMLSLIIGIERQFRQRTVGLRTNVLVCIGSFMFVSLSFNNLITDTTRLAAQVISGIGFLGAGIILRNGDKVKGLNTAATLWCVAAIGVLCAHGMFLEASIGTTFILIANILLRTLAQRIMNSLKTQENCLIDIKCFDIEEKNIKSLIIKLTNKYNLNIKSFEKFILDNNEINLKIIITSNDKVYFNEIAKNITISSNVNSLYIEHNNITNVHNDDINDE